MHVEMIYDTAPEQITIPFEFRGKSIHTIIYDTPKTETKKRTFAEALLSIPTTDDEYEDDLFARDS